MLLACTCACRRLCVCVCSVYMHAKGLGSGLSLLTVAGFQNGSEEQVLFDQRLAAESLQEGCAISSILKTEMVSSVAGTRCSLNDQELSPSALTSLTLMSARGPWKRMFCWMVFSHATALRTAQDCFV